MTPAHTRTSTADSSADHSRRITHPRTTRHSPAGFVSSACTARGRLLVLRTTITGRQPGGFGRVCVCLSRSPLKGRWRTRAGPGVGGSRALVVRGRWAGRSAVADGDPAGLVDRCVLARAPAQRHGRFCSRRGSGSRRHGAAYARRGTTSRRPSSRDPSRSRCCIGEKQRRRADCSYPCVSRPVEIWSIFAG
jgi:hypothetical protein